MLKLCRPNRPLKGTIRVPGDKSVSHRAVMLGALAEGTTEITGFLESDDCLATIDCFRKLGITIERSSAPSGPGLPCIRIHGKGPFGLSAPSETLYTGNSGTTTRLMAGILAAQPFSSVLDGDASIRKRPMKRIIAPLRQMGARIEGSGEDGTHCPLYITGAPLHGIFWRSRVASAQVKSCILLAGLYADGDTTVHEPSLSRDHTERMLRLLGTDVTTAEEKDGATIALHPARPVPLLRAARIDVPGDISSAAYFIAAALLVPGSELYIRNVGVNPTRDGILRVLEQMGADITLLPPQDSDASEPRADLRVRYAALHGADDGTLEIGGDLIPRLIDELPVLAVIAATVRCTTIIRDAAELKVKESNRIDAVCANLQKMGCDASPTDDGMIIRGGAPLHGARIETRGDHRIAMSFAVLALAADGETSFDDTDCIDISYPGFLKDLQTLLR